MKNGKERQKSGRSVLARILLCMMTVWILTGCGSNRTHWRDALREDEEQKEENYDLKDEGKDDTKDEEEIGETEETESNNLKEEEEKEKEKESRDLELMNSLYGALGSAIADAKVTGAGTITIGSDAMSLNQAFSTGPDSEKVLNAMKESMGSEREVKLYSEVGSGRDIICYYDTKNNLILIYVEQHDDSVGGSEVQIRDGVIVQNCKYHDHAPLMASNGAAPRRLY